MSESVRPPGTSRLLLVDDNESHLRTLVSIMQDEGFDVVACATAAEAAEHLNRGDIGVAVIDLRLPDLNESELLSRLEAYTGSVDVILNTGYASYRSARDAVNIGAFAYVEKTDDPDALVRHVHRAFEKRLHRYADELEHAVAERTRDLQEANAALTREIEERRRVEEALRDNEARLRRFYESDVAGFARTRVSDGALLMANDYIVRLLGYEDRETCLAEYVASEHYLDPSARGRMLTALRETGRATGLEVPMTRRDRSVIWIAYSAVLDPEGECIEFVVLDVTERKRAEEEIASLARFPSEDPNPVLRIAGDGAVLFGNAASESLLAAWQSGVGRPAPERWRGLVAECLDTRKGHTAELLHAGRIFRLSAFPVVEAGYVNLYASDVTERELAVRALEESEEKYRQLFTAETDAIMIFDGETLQVVDVNPAALNLYGYTRDEFLTLRAADISAEPKGTRASIMETLRGHRTSVPLRYHRKKDGTAFPVEISGSVFTTGGRRMLCGTIWDISERMNAERALRLSRFSLDHGGVAVLWIGPDGGLRDVNEAACQSLGYAREELLSMSVHDIDPNFPAETFPEQWDRLREHGTIVEESIHRAKDGAVFPVEVAANYVEFEGEEYNCAFVRDIRERKQRDRERAMTIEALRLINAHNNSHELMRTVAEGLKGWSGCDTVGIRRQEGDDFPYFEADGFSAEFVAAETRLCSLDDEGMPIRGADGVPVLECMCGNVLQGRTDPSKPFFTEHGSFWTNSTTELLAGTTESDRQGRTRNRCNREGYESLALVPLRCRGETLGLLQFNDRRTGRFTQASIALLERLADNLAIALAQRRAAEALGESEARYRALVENQVEAVCRWLPDTTLTYVNEGYCRASGRGRHELLGRKFITLVPEEGRDAVQRHIEDLLARPRVAIIELAGVAGDGTIRWQEWTDCPIFDESGRLVEFQSVGRDTTARRQAAEDLREAEEQLRQAQKLDALGTLAGGIAHEFNNLLMGIVSLAHLLLKDVEEGSPAYHDLAEIRSLTDRGAALTRQLLAFSRRQPVERMSVDLNALVSSTVKFLGRVIPEDVALEFTPAPDMDHVDADPGQLQQVLINLTLNARDAMPQGGTLTIETARVVLDTASVSLCPGLKPGPHAVVTVSDTGCGMDEETLARIFEPFFTTKKVGDGTGLGLAMAYGIIEQHNGHIRADSRAGEGTTVTIYLPLAEADRQRDASGRPDRAEAPRGTETILVVDDDAAVRRGIARLLEDQGYTVLSAGAPRQAVDMLRQLDATVDLLLTDVVMPDCSGPELRERLAAQTPALKAIFMSGYPSDTIGQHGLDASDAVLLKKPFDPATLARTVREVLDAASQRRQEP